MAAEYDRHRPAYPDELVGQACQVAGIGSGDHVLEVGCGSGQLTRGLAGRGLHVTALEPGKSLIALARRNLATAPASSFDIRKPLFVNGNFSATTMECLVRSG
jgi:16S rRNA A1518/A1519 N6-dimethyltransferase RsmA/KsgA/DIM1 with predicted DNA glycosylase/AP lyase activity